MQHFFSDRRKYVKKESELYKTTNCVLYRQVKDNLLFNVLEVIKQHVVVYK